MKRSLSVLFSLGLLFAVSVPTLFGQGAESKATPPAAGIRAELVTEVSGLEKKIVSLAEKMPAEKYPWRPGEGVRSVSEVYMHIAGANFFIPTFAGVKLPEGVERGMEKSVTEKPKVVETLKKSFEHVRQAIMAASDADLDKKVKVMGGGERTIRAVYLLVVNHMHEHLGQSIAYARVNGVVPPWSEGAEQPGPPAKKPGS